MLEGEFAEGRAHRPPACVGAYRIVRELGRGGMGVVYEAVQESMGRRVALKVLFPSVAPAGHAVRRFRQEARIAGSLKHTNIVSVHDLGQEAGLWYCAMELVDGTPLDQAFYARFEPILGRYPRTDLQRDFFQVVLEKPAR